MKKRRNDDAWQNNVQARVNKTKRELRTRKLTEGKGFLCLENHLPTDQAIYEYPEGTFKVVRMTGILAPAEFVRMATPEEITHIRETNPAYPEFYL